MVSSPAGPKSLTSASKAAPPIASALGVVGGEFGFQGLVIRIAYSTSPTLCSFLVVRIATE